MAPAPGNVTQLLNSWAAGDRTALDSLIPLVQAELRRLAGVCMSRERGNHVLQPTALVNEAFVRLVDQGQMEARNRAHFFGLAGRLMRQILVDYARTASAVKRGGGFKQITMDESLAITPGQFDEVLDLHEALEDLAREDERKAKVVEMRYFAGLDVDQTASALQVSPNTVIRDWSFARAWLMRRLDGKK